VGGERGGADSQSSSHQLEEATACA